MLGAGNVEDGGQVHHDEVLRATVEFEMISFFSDAKERDLRRQKVTLGHFEKGQQNLLKKIQNVALYRISN